MVELISEPQRKGGGKESVQDWWPLRLVPATTNYVMFEQVL